MSATILAFPSPSPIQALCRPSDGSAPFSPAWCAQHLPLIDAAMLEADDVEFARQCEAKPESARPLRQKSHFALLAKMFVQCSGSEYEVAERDKWVSLRASAKH